MTSYSDFHMFQAGDIVIPLDKAQDCGQTQAPEDLRVLSWNWATGGPSQGEGGYAFVSLALNLKKKKAPPKAHLEYITQEYVRACLIAHESQPKSAFHEGWGRPGTLSHET